MKEWIKKLTDNDISNLYKDKKSLIDVPKNVRNKVLSFIEEKQKERILEEKKEFLFFKSVLLKPAFALVIILVILIPLIWFINLNLNKNKTDLISKSIYGKGNIIIIRDSKNFDLMSVKSINNNDIIKSDFDSQCKLELSGNIKIFIDKNSILKIINIYSNNKLDFNSILNYGKVLFSIKKFEKDSSFIVQVDNYIISVLGTEFLVEKTDDYIFIAVNEGKLKVEDKNNKEISYLITTGNSIKIQKENFKIESFNDEIKKYFNLLIKDEKNNLQNKEIKKISIEEKNEKKEKTKNIFFKFFKKEYKNLEEEIWTEKIIYQSSSEENNLIGVCCLNQYIVAQFNNGIICFKDTGEIIWGKFYKKKMFFSFSSIPVIINEKIYAFSGGDKVIIYDIKSGKELKFFDCPDTLNEKINIINYKDKLFFPLNKGIFILETDFDYFQSEPLIYFNKAKCYLFNDYLYIFYEPENKIFSYSLNGKFLWEYKISNKYLKNPFFVNQYLYLIDIKNNIIKIDQYGNLIDKIQIQSNIKSFNYNYDSIFLLLEDYKLFKIDLNNLKLNKTLKIKNLNKKEVSLIDYCESIDNTILINSQNELIVLNIDQETITKKINISNATISTKIDNNKFIITTDIGNIFLLKKNIINIE